MNSLQQQSLKKLNLIIIGNGGELRSVRLFNIRDLIFKDSLTKADELILQHFIDSDRRTIEQTTYIANTAVYPSSWGHTTTQLRKKK
jgi:hypothetical protein